MANTLVAIRTPKELFFINYGRETWTTSGILAIWFSKNRKKSKRLKTVKKKRQRMNQCREEREGERSSTRFAIFECEEKIQEELWKRSIEISLFGIFRLLLHLAWFTKIRIHLFEMNNNFAKPTEEYKWMTRIFSLNFKVFEKLWTQALGSSSLWRNSVKNDWMQTSIEAKAAPQNFLQETSNWNWFIVRCCSILCSENKSLFIFKRKKTQWIKEFSSVTVTVTVKGVMTDDSALLWLCEIWDLLLLGRWA